MRSRPNPSNHEIVPTSEPAATILAISRFLFETIDRTEDPQVLNDVGEILDSLMPLLDRHLEGLGFELWLWLGLKQEQPVMADKYRRRLDAQTRSR
jgi:hypothetical protein